MMCDFLGEADAAARIQKAVDTDRRCRRHDHADRRRDRRRLLTSLHDERHRDAHHADREDLDERRARPVGRRARSTSSRTRCTTAWACSRASAPTRPSAGPAVFRLTEHIERLFDSAQIMMMDIPYTVDELVQAMKDTVRVDGSAVVLHPADRVLRLRRDGAQHAAVRGRRRRSRAGRGARTSATTR